MAAVDPTNPQSWNRYTYVMNNPLGFIDPTGMILCSYGDDDFEDADDDNECTNNDGTVVSDQTTVTVNGDDPGDVGTTIENGGQIFPEVIQNSAANNPPPCSASQSKGTTSIVSGNATTNAPTIPLGATIGGAIGGPPGGFLGGIIGSFFGVGGTVSYVPSTNSW